MTEISDHIRAYMFSQGGKKKLTFGGHGSQMRPTEETLEAMLFAIENGYQQAVEADEGRDRITLLRTDKTPDPELMELDGEDVFEFMDRAGRKSMFRQREEDEPAFLLSELENILQQRAAPAPSM